MTDKTEAGPTAARVAAWMVERDNLIATLGIVVVDVEDGSARTRITLEEAHANSFGTAHGGVLFALADAAFGYACNAGNRLSVAGHAAVEFLAPAYPGEVLTASASRTATRGRGGVYDVTVTNGRGETVALFRGVARQIGGEVVAGSGGAVANLFADLPAAGPDEAFETLAGGDGVTIERIVSTGQATPPGDWLVQDRHEWVVLLKGRASLRFEDEDAPRALAPGDWVAIPAGTRHRVEWTAAAEPTVWLAVHHR